MIPAGGVPAGGILAGRCGGGEAFLYKNSLSSVIVHRFASPLFLDQPFASLLISLSPLYWSAFHLSIPWSFFRPSISLIILSPKS